MLETEAEDSYLYTFGLHLKYLSRTMYHYAEHRLPRQLSFILLRRNLFWVKELKSKASSLNMHWPESNPTVLQWNQFSRELLNSLKQQKFNERIQRKNETTTRIYKHLDVESGKQYFIDNFNTNNITWIFKARSGLISLNYNRFGAENMDRHCKLCNLHVIETFQHFLGICPVLRELRLANFRKSSLREDEIINILNGQNKDDWVNLVNYLKCSLKYRNFLITEFDQ